MKVVNLNHWFIRDNELSISLMNYGIKIIPIQDNNNLYYKLIVINRKQEELIFFFNKLEEAVQFTEDIIARCKTDDEIYIKYSELYSEQNNIKNEENMKTIVLNQHEVNAAIIMYYGKNINYQLSSQYKLTMENNNPKITFFLIEHHIYNGIKKDIVTELTEEDLKNVFTDYLNCKELDSKLIEFKYCGGIHHMYYEEDQPYYTGIILYIKQKNNNKKLLKN